MAKFCMNCGSPLNETDLFCANCGTKVEPPQTPEQPAPADPVFEEPVPETPEVPYAQPVFHSQTAESNTYEPTPAPQPAYQQPAQPYPQNAYPQNGYPQNAYPQNNYPQNGYPQGYPAQQPPKKKHTGLIIGIIIAVVVILGLVIGAILLVLGALRGVSGGGNSGGGNGGNSGGSNSGAVTTYTQPEDVVASYYDAMQGLMTGSSNVNDFLSLSYEINFIKPEYKSEIESTLTESYGDLSLGDLSSLFGEDFHIDYRIDDVITMSTDDQEDFIKDNELSEYCDTSAIEGMARVKTVMTMTGSLFESDLEEEGDEEELVCIKANGRWYLSFISIE